MLRLSTFDFSVDSRSFLGEFFWPTLSCAEWTFSLLLVPIDVLFMLINPGGYKVCVRKKIFVYAFFVKAPGTFVSQFPAFVSVDCGL